jgi:hypothetical protein|tara:strand:- start:5700 stop:5855 length:156 start_codon:yes stop_codon:yes gene_type:complete
MDERREFFEKKELLEMIQKLIELGVNPEIIAEKMDLDCEDIILLAEKWPRI